MKLNRSAALNHIGGAIAVTLQIIPWINKVLPISDCGPNLN
jgi:hypothetical protein